MPTFLGPVGALQQVRAPGRGFSPKIDDIGSLTRTLAGNLVQQVTSRKRTVTLTWQHLTTDEFGVLAGLRHGAFGPGPFVLSEPSQRNLLTANQSSGTDALRTTDGFAAQGAAASIASSVGLPPQGVRWLALTTATTGSAGTSIVKTGDGTDFNLAVPALDVPVVPGQSYTLSWSDQRSGTGDAAAQFAARIRWYSPDGLTTVGTTNGTAYTPATSTTARSLTGVAPAGAGLARLYWTNVTAVSSSTVLYLDAIQLEQATSARPWVVGTGVPRYVITDLTPTVDLVGFVNASMTLVEV